MVIAEMSERKHESDSDDENTAKKIRRPIPSSSHDVSGIPASPPRFVSLEELMSAAKGMTNMSLAHEITVNKEFKLEVKEPPANSIEKMVKETLHKAFWDILTNELAEDPPKYTQAFVLLEEVKRGLLDLLLPQHSRIKMQIDQVLDIELIKQQAEQGTLDFQEYAQFVISLMGRMCAPVRDEQIRTLTQTKEIVPLFRGILQTLELMHVDMANFTIDVMRPHIAANSIAYEKKKFADFIKLQPDGLSRTRDWLAKHLDAATASTSSEEDGKRKIENVLNDAYLDLVKWDLKQLLPETLTMDESRIRSSTDQFQLLTRVGTVLLLTYSRVGNNLTSIAEWKQKTKETVLALLTPPDVAPLASVATTLTLGVREAREKYNLNFPEITDLESVISAADDPDNKVFALLHGRILEFLKTAITSRTAEPLRIPIGLTILQNELTELAGNFMKMVTHNRAVFEEYYITLIEELLRKKTTATNP